MRQFYFIASPPGVFHRGRERRDNDSKMPARRSLGLFSFFISELQHGYELTNDPQRFKEKRRKVYAFFEVPRELEKFLFYGFLQCVDAFLYFFTLLPLRMLVGIFKVRLFCARHS